MIVIDASIAVKWFVEETGSELARKLLLDRQGYLHIPDIFIVEVAATLVREANTNKSGSAFFAAGLARLIDMIERQSLRLERTQPSQILDAGRIAIDLGHPMKDCIYLALAMERGCELITADARFAEKARGVWPMVRLLGDGV